MGMLDPNLNFRMPAPMRQMANLVAELEEYPDVSDLMRRTLQDRLYLFIGKTVVRTMKWDGALKLLRECTAVPHVDSAAHVKSSQKG